MEQHFLDYLATLSGNSNLLSSSLGQCFFKGLSFTLSIQKNLSPKITTVRPCAFGHIFNQIITCFLIYRAFAFLSTLRPQWYCRTIPDPANSTWVKKYPIVEVRYKITLAVSILLMMTISKEILLGIS